MRLQQLLALPLVGMISALGVACAPEDVPSDPQQEDLPTEPTDPGQEPGMDPTQTPIDPTQDFGDEPAEPMQGTDEETEEAP